MVADPGPDFEPQDVLVVQALTGGDTQFQQPPYVLDGGNVRIAERLQGVVKLFARPAQGVAGPMPDRAAIGQAQAGRLDGVDARWCR